MTTSFMHAMTQRSERRYRRKLSSIQTASAAAARRFRLR